MRTSVFVGASVDSFIARFNGAFDFLSGEGGERDNGYEQFFSTVRRPLHRAKYLAMSSWFLLPPGPGQQRLRPQQHAASRFCSQRIGRRASVGKPAEILSLLEARGFQHVYVDGGLTVQAFLRAGLINRLVITRVPVLIGSGIPLFGPVDADIRLEHVATRQLSGGAIQSEYSVAPVSSPTA